MSLWVSLDTGGDGEHVLGIVCAPCVSTSMNTFMYAWRFVHFVALPRCVDCLAERGAAMLFHCE